jgi:hypothetical protein
MSKASAIAQRYLWASLAISFIVGLVIGLVVLGWTIWPVQWTNATPADLHQAWQRTYVTMAADSLALTGDATAARERLTAMTGPKHDQVQVTQDIRDIASARSKAGDTAGAARLLALATAITGAPSVGPTSAGPTQAAPTAGPTKAGTVAPTVAPTKSGAGAAAQATTAPKSGSALKGTTPLSSFLRICGLVILVLVVIAGLLLLLYFLQARTSESNVDAALTPVDATVKPQTTTPPMAIVPPPAVVTTPPPLTVVPPVTTAPAAPAAVVSTPPPLPGPATLGPFVATYNLGDVDFDMSFGIESPNGDFLGECGLGTADTTGSGDVQRVTAFEVWLFDKTDIRTVSVVLASAHAFEDAALHTKLAARGDVVLAKPGEAFTVKTTSLQLQGRILDMAYGGEPTESYFTTFSVELTPIPQSKNV